VKKAIGFYPSPDLDTAGTQVVSPAGAVLLTEAIVAVHRVAAWASVAQASDAMNQTTKTASDLRKPCRTRPRARPRDRKDSRAWR
jgi:hypothetical protein